MNVYDLLQKIKSVSGRNEKLDLLASAKGTDIEEVLKKVLFLTYSSNINFYVKKFPAPASFGGGMELSDALDKLSSIYERKVTGKSAQTFLTNLCGMLSEQNAFIITKILERDLDIGVAARTINKIWPKVIYIHPYRRCSGLDEKTLKNVEFDCFSQTKEDGMYNDIVVKDGKVTYMSRSGEIKKFNFTLRDEGLIEHAEGYVLMGEALALDFFGKPMNRKEGNGYLDSDDVDTSRVYFVLWDMVPYDEWIAEKGTEDYKTRFIKLKQLTEKGIDGLKLVDTRICKNVDDLLNHAKELIADGLEGTVIKNFKGVWEPGTSKDQIKVKIVFEVDLKIVDVKEGTSKYAGKMGAVICESSDGLVRVSVGGGWSDGDRDKLWKNKESIIGMVVPVKANDLIQNVKTEIDGTYSFFLPRAAGSVRKDKTVADTLEEIKKQRDSYEFVLRSVLS